MAFDPSTATLVQERPTITSGFDPSTAIPVDDKPVAQPPYVKQFGKDFIASTASAIDFPLSLPGFVASAGSELLTTTAGAIASPFTGETPKQVYQRGAKVGEAVGGALMNPMQKIVSMFGEAESYANAPLPQLMSWFGEKLQAGGKKLEEATGIPSESVPLMANVAMAAGVPTGAKWAAGKVTEGVGKAFDATTKKPQADVAPPPGASSEALEAFKAKQRERVATSPLVEAAIRNKETGEIERMGPKHDPARKAETIDTHDQGFVTEGGVFYERMDAVDQAKRSGQIPEDHILENAPKRTLTDVEIEKAGGFEMPLDQVAKKGDDTMSPWLMADGKIVGTGQDHIGFAGNLIETGMPNGYSDFMNQTGAIRASMGIDGVTGEYFVTLHMAEGQTPTAQQVKAIADIESIRGKPVDILLGKADGMVNPEYKPTTLKKLQASVSKQQPGLHSGDLRAAGDERFSLTPKETVPKTREEFKKLIDKKEERLGLELYIDKEEATRAGDVEGLKAIAAEEAKLTAEVEQLRKDMPAVEFQNLAKPTPEELHDHLWASKNVGEAIDRVLGTKGLGRPSQRALLKVLNKSDFIRSAGFKHTQERVVFKDMGTKEEVEVGHYNHEDHTVQLNAYSNIRALIHESVHAGTVKLLEEGTSKAAIRMKALFDKYHEVYSVKYDKAFEQFLKDNPTATFKEQAAFNENYDHVYGFKNIREFVSEAFSRNSFQKILAEQDIRSPAGKLVDLWQEFKDIVREHFGIPAEARTALDDVLDAGSALMRESKDFKHEPKDVTSTKSSPSRVSTSDELAAKTTPKVATASEKVDPRSIANQEEFDKHAADIYDRYGEEEAVKFFEDYEKNKREQSLPIPNDYKSLDDSFHKMNTFQTKDKSELVTWYKNTVKDGKITKAQLEDWFTKRERGEELPPEAQALHEAGDKELKALIKKIKANGGDVGQEFTTGQSRIRLWGDVASNWKETVTEFFSNKTPYTEKVAEQANAAMERKVFQLDDGRVIELHKQTKDTKTDTRTIRKGTEVWEWKNGKKKMISHSESDLKLGDKITLGGKEVSIIDGKVPDIESHAPYRYLKDSLASQALAIMALRKQSRDLEFANNLIKSELFKQVGHGPDQPLKDLPDGWKVPASLDKIPQLRGWHFDPKTAAIIEDFAKVWDNHLLSKMSNAVVKNMMLNPIPHIFNEVMHLWNARGFTSWVPLTGGWSALASSGSKAWRDVGNQTQFYRDVIREGGSILGADPRNKYFDTLQKEASKDYFKTPEMERSLGNLAKKLGTTVGDLYNGISNKSQQAMWFTRDVMYVQWIHEIMGRHEKRTGSKMELKDAIIEAERHMPNYRMPSEVLGSRGLSKILRNPNVSMFSRYHYGMVKSLVNTIKDINPQNLKSPEGRKHFREGVDSMLAIGVAMAVVYPLMDKLAQAMFGEGAEQRRAGPFHLIHAAEQVIKGERDASALIWPVFTFNPMLLTLGQAAFNHNIFTGKQIYHPNDPAKDIAKDLGTYAAKQIPQAPMLMGVGQDEDTTGQLLAKQLDIKVKTEKQRAATEKAKEREKRAAKARLTKREKGTYKP